MRGVFLLALSAPAALCGQDDAAKDRDHAWVAGTSVVLERRLAFDGEQLPAEGVLPTTTLAFSGDGEWLAVCVPSAIVRPGGAPPTLALVRLDDGEVTLVEPAGLRHVVGPGAGERVIGVGTKKTDVPFRGREALEAQLAEVLPSSASVREHVLEMGRTPAPLLMGGRVRPADGSVLVWWSHMFVGSPVGIAHLDGSVRQLQAKPLAVRDGISDPGGTRVAVSQYLPDSFGGGIAHTLTVFDSDGAVQWQRSTRGRPLAFAHDGGVLLVGEASGVVAHDAKTGRPRTESDRRAIWWAQVDPVLAVSHDGTSLTLWDGPRLLPVRDVELDFPVPERGPRGIGGSVDHPVAAAALSSDGARLALVGLGSCRVYRIER